MALSSTANRASFTGNGSTTDLPFSYYFQDKSDLIVRKVLISSGVGTTLALDTDYTISGTKTNGVYANGGTISITSAPSSSYKIVAYRDPALTQGLDLVENDAMPAESIEQAFDKRAMIEQRLDERADRSVRLTEDFTGSFDPQLPPLLTASTVIKINSGATGFEIGPTVTEISNAQTYATNASTSASAAATSASAAATSASAAASSATAAATSATNAATSETNVNSAISTHAAVTATHGATGAVVGTTNSQTLTNKTLTAPIISTISNTGTLTLPTSTDTLVGRATTDTLTNKTLTAPVIATIVNSGTLTLPTSADTLVGRATTDTLTNKTLTSPTINGGSFTGGTDIVVADGGTGVSSLTAYAVMCGGTTSTGAVQSIAGVGSSGQVLTSNGASALPTFQAVPTGTAYGWSGHQGTPTWTSSGTGTTMADFPTATGTVVEKANENFGTVIAANSGSAGNDYPGIKFTPPVTGTYLYTCSFSWRKDTAADGSAIGVYDGTTQYSTIALTTVNQTASEDNIGAYSAVVSLTAGTPINLRLRVCTNTGNTKILSATGSTNHNAIIHSIIKT